MPSLAEEGYCYLTTTGRVSGEPREIEIWFALDGETLYMLSGGHDRSDWVKNLKRAPAVTVRIGARTFPGSARVVQDAEEQQRARDLVARKYDRLGSEWHRGALPVAVELEGID